MKAYAEYFEDKGDLFRRNTILQFGESWELIGNIVLANPGSADPLCKVTNTTSSRLDEFYNQYRNNKFIVDNWFEFSTDPTMGFIEKIFKGSYVGKDINLNGVIQLFNTFNIKNQNLEDAIKQIGTKSDILFSYGIESYFHSKPTYFGFSSDVLNDDVLSNVALHIFNNSSETVRRIYNNDFSANKFYHPMYINRAYNQKHFQWYKDSVLLPLIEST